MGKGYALMHEKGLCTYAGVDWGRQGMVGVDWLGETGNGVARLIGTDREWIKLGWTGKLDGQCD